MTTVFFTNRGFLRWPTNVLFSSFVQLSDEHLPRQQDVIPLKLHIDLGFETQMLLQQYRETARSE